MELVRADYLIKFLGSRVLRTGRELRDFAFCKRTLPPEKVMGLAVGHTARWWQPGIGPSPSNLVLLLLLLHTQATPLRMGSALLFAWVFPEVSDCSLHHRTELCTSKVLCENLLSEH